MKRFIVKLIGFIYLWISFSLMSGSLWWIGGGMLVLFMYLSDKWYIKRFKKEE